MGNGGLAIFAVLLSEIKQCNITGCTDLSRSTRMMVIPLFGTEDGRTRDMSGKKIMINRTMTAWEGGSLVAAVASTTLTIAEERGTDSKK